MGKDEFLSWINQKVGLVSYNHVEIIATAPPSAESSINVAITCDLTTYVNQHKTIDNSLGSIISDDSWLVTGGRKTNGTIVDLLKNYTMDKIK
jgi:hypothetical protein